MAYRRRQQATAAAASASAATTTARPPSISTTFRSYQDDEGGEDGGGGEDFDKNNSSTSLAAKAIRASSAARRDSSLSSAYGFNPSPSPSPTFSSSFSSAASNLTTTATPASNSSSYYSGKESRPYEYTSMKNINEPKQGFWSSLARKAKSILDDDNPPQQVDSPGRNVPQMPHQSAKPMYQNSFPSANESQQKTEHPALQKGINAISSSLNYIGNAVEEGLMVVENRTADIIQETRKHIRKKPSGAAAENQATNHSSMWQQPHVQTHTQSQTQTDLELQLKASRDVAMAMAAKAKLLLRELKTVKADLAFARERCAQLEEQNKILRDNRDRGENPEDDDLIRLQLETLLAEKARLAHENSIYARENRFLREVVEYHQLTMQDVVYLDEGTEEVTEVYPIKVVSNSHTSVPTEVSFETSNGLTRDAPVRPVPPLGLVDFSQSTNQP